MRNLRSGGLIGIMERAVSGTRVLRLVRGDITLVDADAIVNAANAALAGGGGVDGAIHRAGGPAIMEELRAQYAGCPPGSAVMTSGGNLPARHVVHAVGPIWQGGEHHEDEVLASAYTTAFHVAAEYGCRTLATVSISTGVYGFPVHRAAPIACGAALNALLDPRIDVEEITFMLIGDDHIMAFRNALTRLEIPDGQLPQGDAAE